MRRPERSVAAGSRAATWNCGNRIMPARMPRMAARDAGGRETRPRQRTMGRDRLGRVRRTARREAAARRQPRTDDGAIDRDRAEQDLRRAGRNHGAAVRGRRVRKRAASEANAPCGSKRSRARTLAGSGASAFFISGACMRTTTSAAELLGPGRTTATEGVAPAALDGVASDRRGFVALRDHETETPAGNGRVRQGRVGAHRRLPEEMQREGTATDQRRTSEATIECGRVAERDGLTPGAGFGPGAGRDDSSVRRRVDDGPWRGAHG